MSFIKRFQKTLESLIQLSDHSAAETQYVVAYSGGVDSHVLLSCCKQLDLPVRAVHVHHGLQDVADDWVKHCQSVCEQLSIPIDIFYVDAKQRQGQSPEETARNVRYDAIHKNLRAGDCLLTAQHKNDQAETVLLQLFRTASAAGLAAMPAYKKIDIDESQTAVHVRPLLSFSRDEIITYANQNNFHWVEDPSNQDTVISRNFIRKEVLPILESRWPQLTTQLSTVASLQAANLQVLEDMAAIDLANLIVDNDFSNSKPGYVYNVVSILCVEGLQVLSSARLMNVLRMWVMQSTEMQASRNLLSELERTLVHSSVDAKTIIKFFTYEFRKYKNKLYLLKKECSSLMLDDIKNKKYPWSATELLDVSILKLQLSAKTINSNGLSNHLRHENLTVSFRKGGEHFHPAGRKHSQSLKKLMQEEAIPPWQRGAIPLVYFEDELIAVADLWIAKNYLANSEENGWCIQLRKL